MALLGIAGLGVWELLVIALILVLIFGARRLGDVGRSLGEGIKNFRSAMKDGSQDSDSGRRDNESSTSAGPKS